MRRSFLLSIITVLTLPPYRSDIDFEYPSGIAQGRTFASLLTELRSALDALAKNNGDTVPYQLTVSSFYTTSLFSNKVFLSKVAVPAGYEKYASLRVAQMDPALNYWNLMV